MKCPKLKTYKVTIQVPVTVRAVNEEHARLEAHLTLRTSLETCYYKGHEFTRPQEWELDVEYLGP